MLLSLLIQIPLFGIFLISCLSSYNVISVKTLKVISLAVTISNLFLSLAIWIFFDNSSKHYQFVQEHHNIAYYDFYLGLDSLSVFFVILTTLIFPIAIMSNWKSIKERPVFFLILILLLESALLLIFLVLDILMFYIFFESILAPLFILIGVFGSSERIRAGFYFFLYTFLGSLFMLLSILTMLSLIGCTDFDILSKANFVNITQIFLFIGIFIAFAVKTPVIYLNGWLLKAHVESPLSGSIVLAAIVLKLSLYGVFRLVLPLLPKAFLALTFIIFVICVITIFYASLSTIRTIDVKELIAYSSVSHAAVYLAGILSNTIHGIQGGIALGLAHGFVSSGLFMTAGGVLYDRSGTRLITYYSGIAQIMPILSIIFFILSLGNCGAPLTFNFVGEFMALYGVFERLPIAGILGSTSIVFSAAYTIYMYNRIVFGGSNSGWYWEHYIPDLNKREFNILFTLTLFTVALGIYPAVVLDSLNYSVTSLLYSISTIIHHDSPEPAYELLFMDNPNGGSPIPAHGTANHSSANNSNDVLAGEPAYATANNPSANHPSVETHGWSTEDKEFLDFPSGQKHWWPTEDKEFLDFPSGASLYPLYDYTFGDLLQGPQTPAHGTANLLFANNPNDGLAGTPAHGTANLWFANNPNDGLAGSSAHATANNPSANHPSVETQASSAREDEMHPERISMFTIRETTEEFEAASAEWTDSMFGNNRNAEIENYTIDDLLRDPRTPAQGTANNSSANNPNHVLAGTPAHGTANNPSANNPNHVLAGSPAHGTANNPSANNPSADNPKDVSPEHIKKQCSINEILNK